MTSFVVMTPRIDMAGTPTLRQCVARASRDPALETEPARRGAQDLRNAREMRGSGSLAGRRGPGLPELPRQQAKGDEDQLRGDEAGQRAERAVHEPVRVQPDAEHVDAEPG